MTRRHEEVRHAALLAIQKDGPARSAVDERTEKRRSRARSVAAIVQVAKGKPSVRSGAEDSAFKERWQGVLNRPPPPPSQP